MKNSVLTKLQKLSVASVLSHAWLFVGPENSNKLQIAMDFSQWLLCADRQVDKACGNCRQCHLFAAGSHPDFYNITVKEGNSAILVDDLRDLSTFINSKPQFAQKKIVILSPAEKMNKQAANALLKNLEDPGANTFFFLLTTHTDLLLNTILSRCQILHFNADHSIQVKNIEALGKILHNLYNLWVTKSVTPIELVELWVKQWPNEVLYWFELALADLIVCRYTRDLALLKHPESYIEQSAVLSNVNINKLWSMLAKVQQARFWCGKGAKPNMQLILEDVVLP